MCLLPALTYEWNPANVHEGVIFWWIHVFPKRPAAGMLEARIALELKLHKRGMEGTVTSYYKAVSYILET